MDLCEKYIIVLSNDDQAAASFRGYLHVLTSACIDVTTDLKEIYRLVEVRRPSFIFIYSAIRKEKNLIWLQDLRQAEWGDSIPIVVFNELPTVEAIAELIKA